VPCVECRHFTRSPSFSETKNVFDVFVLRQLLLGKYTTDRDTEAIINGFASAPTSHQSYSKGALQPTAMPESSGYTNILCQRTRPTYAYFSGLPYWGYNSMRNTMIPGGGLSCSRNLNLPGDDIKVNLE
jgi:hypothetical protein